MTFYNGDPDLATGTGLPPNDRGIASTIVDGKDLSAWRAAIRPETKLVFFETPSNPQLEIVDVKKVCALAHAAGARRQLDADVIAVAGAEIGRAHV